MHNYLDKETQANLLKLGLYQIFGGGIGILFLLWALINTTNFTASLIVLLVFALSLFSFSIYCGYRCVYLKENCLKYSLANQLLQLVGLSFAGVSYMYAAGVFIAFGLDSSAAFDIKLRFGISKAALSINNSSSMFAIHINLIALILLLWIDRLMRRLRTENEYHKIAEIGNSESIPTLSKL